MIEAIFLVWVLTLGVHALTRESMPFEFLQSITRDKNGELRSILFEPIVECRCCMGSLWTCLYFGYYYQLDWVILAFHFAILNIVLGFSIAFGRDWDVDFFGKLLYFVLIVSFIFFLPSHHKEAFFCMAAVVGLNYHLGKIIG